jgi:ribosomal protein S18 acetylase RimI-like enzyme
MHVVEEWNENIAKALVAGAQEPHIAEHTPRDKAERFASVESAQHWYDQMERHAFPLKDGDKLLGIVWFSKYAEPVEGAYYTFAIRMYEAGLGKHLSEEFTNQALKIMEDQYDMDSVWLETDETNTRAIHLYEKLGFKTVKTEHDRRLMIRK